MTGCARQAAETRRFSAKRRDFREQRARERGAALLIVLLLVATLSFIALAATERTTLAAARSLNERVRAESVWYAFGAETLALAALEAAYDARDGRMSIDDEWANQPLDVPVDQGLARLRFIDDTACFNVNSLALEAAAGAGGEDGDDGGGSSFGRFGAGGPQAPSPRTEFAALARNLGLSEFDGLAIAEVIADWIDADADRRPQGAEDAHYGGLPSPYRTGNAPVAALSELRAMKGVTREIYAVLKPHLCAHPGDAPSAINVNMLVESDAPALAAALERHAGGAPVPVQTASDIIAARPPGGYENAAAFLAEPGVQALGVNPAPVGDRLAVTAADMRARVEIIYDTALFNMTAQIALSSAGQASVLARRFGAEE